MVIVLLFVFVIVERFLVVIVKLLCYIDMCRVVGYVFESWIFVIIVIVVLWIKVGNWGYFCFMFVSG